MFINCLDLSNPDQDHPYTSCTNVTAEFSRFMIELSRRCQAIKKSRPLKLDATVPDDLDTSETAEKSIAYQAGWSIKAARSAKPYLSSWVSRLGTDVELDNGRYLMEPSEDYVAFFKALSKFIMGSGFTQEKFDASKSHLVKEVGRMVGAYIDLRLSFIDLFPAETDTALLTSLLHALTKILKSAMKDFLMVNLENNQWL